MGYRVGVICGSKIWNHSNDPGSDAICTKGIRAVQPVSWGSVMESLGFLPMIRIRVRDMINTVITSREQEQSFDDKTVLFPFMPHLEFADGMLPHPYCSLLVCLIGNHFITSCQAISLNLRMEKWA